MNGTNTLPLGRERAAYGENARAGKVEINAGRVATWTLILTNAFFVSYFLAKLFQLV